MLHHELGSPSLPFHPRTDPGVTVFPATQKLIPVFPWEVERVKPFLVTLVEDLVDRMKVMHARGIVPATMCTRFFVFWGLRLFVLWTRLVHAHLYYFSTIENVPYLIIYVVPEKVDPPAMGNVLLFW